MNPESEFGVDKSKFPASAGGDDGAVELAPRVVRRADLAIAEGRANGFSSRLLGEAFAKLSQLPDDLSAATLFDTFAADSVAPGFSLIGAPGKPLSTELLPGDVLCRRGEGGFGHAAIVAGSDLWPRDHVSIAGLNAESNAPGIYVQVVEGGPNPHTSADCFARRIADDAGWIPRDQMLLRPQRSAFDESFEESVPIRRDEAYVRWIQESLNQVNGAGLVVDGILNPQTNGAIRSFQQGRALVADGIVGPITEQALIDAGAQAPPPPGGEFPPISPVSATPAAVPPSPLTEPRIDPRDERVDVSAKFGLQRMVKRSDMRNDAVRLIDGINSGKLAGIFGDDLQATVRLAQRHGTERWLLVPEGEDGALVLDPAEPLTTPPTIVFRRLTRNTMPGKAIDPKTAEPIRSGQEFGVRDPQTGQQVMTRDLPAERLDAALQKASRSLKLFEDSELDSCDSSPSVVPVTNLVPSSICRVFGTLKSLRLCTPTGEPLARAPFTVRMGSNVIKGVTDRDGFLEVRVPTDQAAFVVDWSDPNESDPALANFTRKVFAELGSGDEADHRRLVNLGYFSPTLQEQLGEFRAEFRRPRNVSDSELRLQVRAWHDGGERPQPSP
jgi:hypothetical protein